MCFQKNIYFCFIDYAKAFDCVDHNKPWTVLKEMGIPDHLTCLLRNRYAGQEASVRTGHGTTDWFQIRKGVCQGCMLSPCLLNFYAEYIMRNTGLEETQREGDDRGWDGWMASPTQWTWVCVDCGSWWWTGRPGKLQFIRLQRVRHDWVTELNWTYTSIYIKLCFLFLLVFLLILKIAPKIPLFAVVYQTSFAIL